MLETITNLLDGSSVLQDITTYNTLMKLVKEKGIVYKAQLLTLNDLLDEEKYIAIDKSYGNIEGQSGIRVETDEYIPKAFVPKMPFLIYDEV